MHEYCKITKSVRRNYNITFVCVLNPFWNQILNSYNDSTSFRNVELLKTLRYYKIGALHF